MISGIIVLVKSLSWLKLCRILKIRLNSGPWSLICLNVNKLLDNKPIHKVVTTQGIPGKPGKVRESEKKGLESQGKVGNFTNFVIYQGKVREKFPAIYLNVKFPKIKCLFCHLIISLIKAIWELQLVGQGKCIKKFRENLEKSGNFIVKIMWQPCIYNKFDYFV